MKNATIPIPTGMSERDGCKCGMDAALLFDIPQARRLPCSCRIQVIHNYTGTRHEITTGTFSALGFTPLYFNVVNGGLRSTVIDKTNQ